MKGRLFSTLLALAALVAFSVGLSAAQGSHPTLPPGVSGGEPQVLVGSAFTYQGELKKDGSPVTASCDMAFRLYDADTAGNLVGAPITTSVYVADGLFTVVLDFGDVFTGAARWLEVSVACLGDPGFATLSPRQELTAAPYALSLQPGAVIEGALSGGKSTLSAVNSASDGYAAVFGRSTADGGWMYGVVGESRGGGSGVYGVNSAPYGGMGVRGYAMAEGGGAVGVWGTSLATDGCGVFGEAVASTGTNYGVYGRSASTSGGGVYGEGTVGVYARGKNAVIGISEEPGYAAIFGRNTAITDTTYGVYGRADSTSGYGVYGRSNYVGVYGETSATGGDGVFGYSKVTNSETCGVYGRADSTEGYGVFGRAAAATGTTYGVYGRSDSPSGRGVQGVATSASGTTYGVYGRSDSTNGRGVYGESNDVGVYGYSNATGGVGVLGFTGPASGQSYGVYGQTNSDNGWAAYFGTSTGSGVYVSTPLGHTGLVVQYGTKNAAVDTDQGTRLLYTEESAEVWFTDYGFGRLQDGSATIVIDPLFAQTVNLEKPYHVFIQVYGGAEVYVSRRTPTAFEVRLWTGDPNVEFSYRIVAKRLGYEDTRLAPFPLGDNPPVLYPDRAPAAP